LLAAAGAGRLHAQDPAAPIIDTIVVTNQNIFDEKDLAELPYIARAANLGHHSAQQQQAFDLIAERTPDGRVRQSGAPSEPQCIPAGAG
jgi:hypothetical protein